MIDRWSPRLAVAALAGITVGAAVMVLLWGSNTPRQIGRPLSDARPSASTDLAEAPTRRDSQSAAEVPPSTDVVDELPSAPIAPRDGQSVVWTGTRLLVFGGSSRLEAGGTPLNDGAAYDPATRTWEALPAAPGGGVTGYVAVWTGTRMLVAGGGGAGAGRAVLLYDPAVGTWHRGADAPVDIRRDLTGSTWTGDRFAVWTPGQGLAEYDPTADVWTQQEPPPIDAPQEPHARTQALHASGDVLYAVAADVREPVQVATRRADGAWTRVEDLGFRSGTMASGDRLTDAQMASHMVATDAGLLAVSRSSDSIPAVLLPPDATDWVELAVPGIPPCEDYPPPLRIPMGAALFNYCGDGAVFDADTRTFTQMPLPNAPPGSAESTVWTGRTLLTYATACCYGARSTSPVMGSWERTLEHPNLE